MCPHPQSLSPLASSTQHRLHSPRAHENRAIIFATVSSPEAAAAQSTTAGGIGVLAWAVLQRPLARPTGAQLVRVFPPRQGSRHRKTQTPTGPSPHTAGDSLKRPHWTIAPHYAAFLIRRTVSSELWLWPKPTVDARPPQEALLALVSDCEHP